LTLTAKVILLYIPRKNKDKYVKPKKNRRQRTRIGSVQKKYVSMSKIIGYSLMYSVVYLSERTVYLLITIRRDDKGWYMVNIIRGEGKSMTLIC
jgi:hypothetical protein